MQQPKDSWQSTWVAQKINSKRCQKGTSMTSLTHTRQICSLRPPSQPDLMQGHMSKVQKELKYLKSKANEAAGKILNDDSITSLQKQILWFKGEAQLLDTKLEAQKRDLQQHKSQETSLKEDRQFLNNQVKEAMKNNKLIQIASEKTAAQCGALRQFLEKNKVTTSASRGSRLLTKAHLGRAYANKHVLSPKSIIDQTKQQCQFEGIPCSESQINIEIDQTNVTSNNKNARVLDYETLSQASSDFRVKEFVLDLFRRGYHKDKITSKISKFFKAYDLSRDNLVEQLQRKLETEKKIHSKIKISKAQNVADKSELESLFLDSIEECKKDIIRRRSLQRNSNQSHVMALSHNTNQEVPACLYQIALNKDVLICAFEEMFGNSTAIINNAGHETQFGNKTPSLKTQNLPMFNNSTSYFSNATTKDQSDEVERCHKIMNAPIESLLNSIHAYSQSGTNAGNKKIGNHFKFNQRASTAIAKPHHQAIQQSDGREYGDTIKASQATEEQRRPFTSHSQNRTAQPYKGKVEGRSRQQQLGKSTSSSNNRSYSVKKGKLVLNPLNISHN